MEANITSSEGMPEKRGFISSELNEFLKLPWASARSSGAKRRCRSRRWTPIVIQPRKDCARRMDFRRFCGFENSFPKRLSRSLRSQWDDRAFFWFSRIFRPQGTAFRLKLLEITISLCIGQRYIHPAAMTPAMRPNSHGNRQCQEKILCDLCDLRVKISPLPLPI